MIARESARQAGQTLFYVQAIDQPLGHSRNDAELYKHLLQIPSVQSTKRLPGVVLFHVGMRMRFTTTVQQPFAVQDVEGVVVGFDPVDTDSSTKSRVDRANNIAEHVCPHMPAAIYMKIDDCEHHFLPPAPCPIHQLTGHDASCLNCLSATRPGIFAVTPLTRKYKY